MKGYTHPYRRDHLINLISMLGSSQTIPDSTIALTELLETERVSVLKAFVKNHGLHSLSNLLKVHQHSSEMIPIVCLTLRVLQHLESRDGGLRGGLTCYSDPHFCLEEFSLTLHQLMKHSDSQTRTLASTLQRLGCTMSKCHQATHQEEVISKTTTLSIEVSFLTPPCFIKENSSFI